MITALILTRNEEQMIEDCLKQLDFVDEIIILDQGSTDKTVEIAQKYTKKIFSTDLAAFNKNREKLASMAQNDWLLYIDADERLDKDAITQMEKATETGNFSAYYFPRKNMILGKWLKHGGWYPDYVPRLFKKTALEGWKGEVHESPIVSGTFGYLKTPITHLTARSLGLMLDKSIKWAKIEAELAYDADHPNVTAPKIIAVVGKEFTKRYFIKFGVLDGFVGFVEAAYQSIHRAIFSVYLWELQNKTHEKFLEVQKEKE